MSSCFTRQQSRAIDRGLRRLLGVQTGQNLDNFEIDDDGTSVPLAAATPEQKVAYARDRLHLTLDQLYRYGRPDMGYLEVRAAILQKRPHSVEIGRSRSG